LRGEKKNSLQAHRHSMVDSSPSLEKVHRNDFIIIVKGCTATSKENARVIRAATLKENQTKYYVVNISGLYLINQSYLNQKNKISFKKTKFNKEQKLK
jgi:hypothetical protein